MTAPTFRLSSSVIPHGGNQLSTPTIDDISDDPTLLDSLSAVDAKNLIESWEASEAPAPAGNVLQRLRIIADTESETVDGTDAD